MDDYGDQAEVIEKSTTGVEGTRVGVEADLSVLGNLRALRDDLLEHSYKDLKVPRWSEPELYVRYRPVKHSIIRAAMDVGDSKVAARRGAKELKANIDVLISGCVGVFALMNGKRYSLRPGDPNGSWTTFDADLAENLGCGQTASEVVRALYIAEGDILSAATALAQFSGYTEAEADEAVEGE